MAKLRDSFEPDYVLVAYGTNDWWWRDEVEFTAKCREFYKALSSHYPHVRIFALAPIWRKECTQKSKFGDFCKVKETIASIVKEFNNIVCIDCFDFVPHDTVIFKQRYSEYKDEILKAEVYHNRLFAALADGHVYRGSRL